MRGKKTEGTILKIGQLLALCKSGHDLAQTRLYKQGRPKGCGVCIKRREKEWQKLHSGSEAEKSKRWREANPEKYKECNRNSMLKRKYGITVAQYEKLLVAQNYVCAICKRGETARKETRLSVDHRHGTKKVRGLLCTKCNTAIGLLDESPGIVLELLNYLKRHCQLQLHLPSKT